MFKIALLSLALFSAVLAETTFELMPKGAKTYEAGTPGFEVSRPEGARATTFAIPPDNGGNFGDNIWKFRVAGDRLLSTEILINGISNQEQQFNWKANFPGKSLTHIRFLNFGRQRGFVESVTGNGGPTASAIMRVNPNNQFRVIAEVYGK